MKLHPREDMKRRLSSKLKSMMLDGAFPQVEFRKLERGGESFNLIAFSQTLARFDKLVDLRIKNELNDPHGICTRAHSAAFMEKVQAIIDSITEADVVTCPEKYPTWFD